MLKIDEKYYLDFDKYNVMLVSKRIKENGELVFKRITYHRNVESALKRYIEIKIKEDAEINQTVEELLNQIQELKNFLSNYLTENIEHLKIMKTKYNEKLEKQNQKHDIIDTDNKELEKTKENSEIKE